MPLLGTAVGISLPAMARRWWRLDDWFRPVAADGQPVATSRPARVKQRAADFIAMFAGLIAGTVYGGALGPRLILSVFIALAGSVLLRAILRVPIWRNPPDAGLENLPPYGEPPSR